MFVFLLLIGGAGLALAAAFEDFRAPYALFAGCEDPALQACRSFKDRLGEDH